MVRTAIGAVSIVLMLAVAAGPANGDPNSVTKTYKATSAVISNPERGFYHHTETHYLADGTGHVPLDAAALRALRSDHITQILRVFYLEKFAGQDTIDPAYLDLVTADFGAARSAGVKVIVRFAYAQPGNAWPPAKPYGDAPVERVVSHIQQLRSVLRANADVIEVVQSGFVGLWGEGYYTDHFSDPDDPSSVSAQNWTDRSAVIDALLDALPTGRMVQVRTPQMKQKMFGLPTGSSGGIAKAAAFNGSDRSRVGHHNDCFLASEDDQGTYVSNPASLDVAFVAQDSKYLPTGGETCAVNSLRSAWASASAEMAKLHFTYLNADYNEDVLNSWGTKIEDAKRKLGYRFVLTQGTLPTKAAPGATVRLTLKIRNDGWATPFTLRKVQVIFKGTSKTYPATVSADPRRWTAGVTTTLSLKVKAPSSAGKYRMFLNIADKTLTAPAYSIRLANSGIWLSATGYNDLLQTLTVKK